MDEDAANARRCDGRGGTYEAWYVTVNDPATRRGFWIRYTTLQPAAGTGVEPQSALWAFGFDSDDPGLNWGGKQTFALDDFQARALPFGLQVGGAELGMRGCHGELRTERGMARWELRWQSREPPFPFLDPGFAGLSTVANIGSRPSLLVSGVIELGGRSHHFENAHGSQQHTWGSSHALAWNWGAASGDGFWVDGATSRVRSRLGLALTGTSVGARVRGESFHFNRLLQVLGSRGAISATGWKAAPRLGEWRLRVAVTPRPEDLIGVTYADPQGGSRYCYHTEVADLELALTCKGRLTAEISRPASAAFEYGSTSPLPGVTVTV